MIPAWEMHAPTTWKLRDSKHFRDPRKLENIDECNELFRQQRLFVMDSCRHLITACKKPRLIRTSRAHRRNCATLCISWMPSGIRSTAHKRHFWNPSAKTAVGGAARAIGSPSGCSTGATNQPAGGKAFGRSDEPGVAA